MQLGLVTTMLPGQVITGGVVSFTSTLKQQSASETPALGFVEELDVLTYDGFRMRVGRTSDIELESIIREGGRRSLIYSQLKSLRNRYASLIRDRFPHIPLGISLFAAQTGSAAKPPSLFVLLAHCVVKSCSAPSRY